MINYNLDTNSNTLFCQFVGRLDTNNTFIIAESVEKKVEDHTGDDRDATPKVVFDIERVDYIASAFIRICIKAVQKAGKVNFSIINASPMIKKTFKIAGLDEELNVS